MTWDLSNYSATPASNSNINGVNIAEACNASGINDAIRQLMADLTNVSAVSPGWAMLPGGIILQWGDSTNAAANPESVTLPRAFPNAFFAVVASPDSGAANYTSTVKTSLSTFDLYKSSATFLCYWIAVGR